MQSVSNHNENACKANSTDYYSAKEHCQTRQFLVPCLLYTTKLRTSDNNHNFSFPYSLPSFPVKSESSILGIKQDHAENYGYYLTEPTIVLSIVVFEITWCHAESPLSSKSQSGHLTRKQA